MKATEIFYEMKKWDLSFLVNFLVERDNYSFDQAEEIVIEYRKYLALVISRIKNGKPADLPISSKIDPAWHAHVLHTKNYISMCKEYVGEFIHHEPMDASGLGDLYKQNTLTDYQKAFGPASNLWKNQAQVCMGVDGEGGCSNQCQASVDQLKNLSDFALSSV